MRALSLAELRALMHGGALPYHEPRVTALVWELKYRANPRAARLAGALLREILLEAAAEELGVPLLVPVPMHPSRRKARGHNHTELLCASAFKSLGRGIDYAPAALVRTRDTPTQQGLARGARLVNVRGSMRASGRVAGRACIVVDDVSTTGATLGECERALKAAGARSVATIALARS